VRYAMTDAMTEAMRQF